MNRKSYIFLLIASIALGSVACHRTNKSVLSEAYHDLTAHYNSEWNANDRLRIVLNNVRQNPGDNYDSLVHIYPYENANTTKTYNGEYEVIIKKATFSIQQHESSKWTDNNFYLMGMAHFLKGDYSRAADHFQYITSNIKEGIPDEFVNKKTVKKKNKKAKALVSKKKAKIKKNKKKGKSTDDISIRPHEKATTFRPSRNPALNMLALSYIKNQEFDKAASVLSYIEADPKFPDNYLAQFYMIKATFYLEQGKYENAISPLKEGIKLIKRKRDLCRPTYVLGQTYQMLEQYEGAITEYTKVLKLHPDYQMEFNTKLNIAKLSADGKGDSKIAKDILSKMSKDGKNAEMLDQIYYQLGRIDYKENLKERAIINFAKSIAKNKTNVQQRALSYAALGDVYFDDEEFKLAKINYDSALTILSKNTAIYSKVKDRADRLGRLVTQLAIIETADSLQALAELPEAERKKKLKEIVNALIKERDNQAKQKIEGASTVNRTDVNDASGNSSFYFNNASARNRGYNTFKRVWGTIKLADNWRRQEKSLSSNGSDASANEEETGVSNLSEYRDEMKRVNDLLPTTEEKKKQFDQDRIEAYFLLANIYKDDFNDRQKSIETFERLLQRYPDNKYKAEIYYNLYLLYAGVNSTKSEMYRELVLREYPNTNLAKFLNDPEYFKKQKSRDQLMIEAYDNAYNLYTKGLYEQSYNQCKEGVTQFKTTRLEPKFAYLAVLNIGKQKKYDDFSQGLTQIIKNYASDPVKDEAEKMLLYLSNLSEYKTQDSIYKYQQAQIKVIDVVNKTPDKSVSADTAKAPSSSKGKDDKKDSKNKDPKVPKDPKVRTIDSTSITKDTSAKTTKDTIASAPKVDDMPAGMDLTKFTQEASGIHRIIIFPKNADAANLELVNKIKAFNATMPIYKKLLVGNVLVNAETKLVTVKEFTNESDAIRYYNDLIKSDVCKGLNLSDYRIMVSTSKNQSVAVGNNLLENLYWFFKKNYLK